MSRQLAQQVGSSSFSEPYLVSRIDSTHTIDNGPQHTARAIVQVNKPYCLRSPRTRPQSSVAAVEPERGNINLVQPRQR